MTKFRPGDRVIDIETGVEGVVLFIYEEIAGEFVVTRLDYDPSFAVAFQPADLRHAAH